MIKPHISRNAALLALLVGLIFIAGNIYLGSIGYRKLANLCFALAVISDVVLAVFMILYVFGKTWLKEPERPSGPMPSMTP